MAGEVLAAGANWFNDDWLYRKQIIIDSSQVPGDLTNFPVLINRTDPDWRDTANGGNVGQSDGGDILFTDFLGNKLSHEIGRYTASTGELIAWVNVPAVSSSPPDTFIYIYYGNTTDPSNQWETDGSTWNINYAMVQHMEDTTTSTLTDSTSNNNDGTKAAANEPIEIDGKIGKGQDFDGSDDYVEINLSETFSEVILGTWIKPNFNYDASNKTLNRIFVIRGDDNVSLLSFYSNVEDKFVLTDRNDSTWIETGDLSGASAILSLLEGSDGALYTAGQGGNDIFKSTDGGDTWVGVFDVGWSAFIFESSNGTLYVGTGGLGEADNLWKSNDRGDTWSACGDVPYARVVFSLIEASDGSLYGGVRTQEPTFYSKVFKSTDGCDSWVNVGGQLGSATGQVNALLEASDGALYAGAATNGGIFKSTDGGSNWVSKAGLMDVYSIIEANDGTLYAGTTSNGDVFKSTDSGETWVATGDLVGVTTVRILLEASDGTLYAGTTSNGDVFKSVDGGDTWVNTGDLAGATNVYSLLESSNGTIYAGANGNVFKVESNVLVSTAQSFSADDWIHLSFFLDGSSKKIFIDGVEDTSTTYSFDGISSVKILLGGDFYNQDGDGGYRVGRRNNFFNGLIDEVRISNTPRPEGWIATSYNNQNSPSTFLTFSEEAVVIPTMTQWGMIIFMILAGLGSIYYLRRQRTI